MYKYICCFLLTIALSGQKIYPQTVSYQLFENIIPSPEASVVTFFIQDPQGLLWIGTNKGLFSYDGYTAHRRFSFNDYSHAYIHCGVIINEHQLWMGTDNGILMYDLKKDEYLIPPSSFPSDIRALLREGDTLWLGTLHGLYSYDFTTGVITYYDRNIYPDLPHETIYSIISTEGKKLYIGTYDGCCGYDVITQTFFPVPIHSVSSGKNQFVNSLLEDKNRDCIWIGMEGELIKFDPETERMQSIADIHGNSIKTMALDANGSLLAGTDNGLYIYNENSPLQHITHDSRNTNSLSNNIIWNIFTDRDKNVWLGTDFGLSFSHYNSDFQFIPISRVTGTGEGNHFYSLYRDSKGYFWLGGTNGIIRTKNPFSSSVDVEWHKMGSSRYPLTHNRIRHIYEDRNGDLWITTDGSIHYYDYERHRFIQYTITDSTGVVNANWAYSLHEDEEGYLWIASYLGGIQVVDKQKLLRSSPQLPYIADRHYTTQNGLSGMAANHIVPDKQGNIWVLLYNNGINIINPYTEEIKKFPVNEFLDGNLPYYLLCDRSGYMWIGFRGGVTRIHPETYATQMISFSASGNPELLSMVEAGEDVWVSTTDGVWIIETATMESKRLSIVDKPFSSFWYDEKDKLVYMGSIDGFAISSPDIKEKQIPEQPVVITSFYINGQPAGNDDIISAESIRYTEKIKLNHTQNNLSFEISDYPYSLEEKSKFVHLMYGLDKEWSVLSPQTNRISYNNLPAGNYQLLISKLDLHGNPSPAMTSLAISISPAWYNSIWARIVYGMCALFLIGWVINFYRVRNRLRIERIEKEKILEQTQVKINFFTHISHDLKTPLSMILAPVSRMLHEMKEPEEKAQLEMIQRNAIRLNTLIHQVLDFNRIESQADTCLILSQTDLVAFSHTIFRVFEEAGKERHIGYKFSSNKKAIYMDLDVVKMESVIHNILSNALKYTPDGGSIELKIAQSPEGDQVEFTVSDTGIGIPEKDLPYVFQRFYQSSKTARIKEGTGVGLYMVKSYTELHNGNVGIESRENEGTTVRLTLPIWLSAAEDVLLQPVASHRNTEKLSILIVEDNPEIAAFLVSILQKEYQCTTAENGKKGLKYCMQSYPDLIITDLMMPVMDGLEMCKQIRKNIQTSTIPIIMLTAKNDKYTELESIRTNIDTFIAKPFEPEIILSRVNQLLEKKEAERRQKRIEIISTPAKPEVISPDEKFLAGVTTIIEDHMEDTELNVNALCELCTISNKQLYRKLKQLTGMTPVDYIRSIRIKKAAMLLQQKKFTIAEVMYMVGFSNHSYFSKCFQAEFGKTPKQYQQEEGEITAKE